MITDKHNLDLAKTAYNLGPVKNPDFEKQVHTGDEIKSNDQVLK
ncbi:hypothetical protein ACR3IL_10505 [Streptococcus iniae]|nr:hypothetical protein [Streptococcus iniae]